MSEPENGTFEESIGQKKFKELYSRPYKIGEMSAITGLSSSSFRFYESKGLFKFEREENGYRYLTAQDGFRVNSIRALQQYGFSIKDSLDMIDSEQETEEFSQALKNRLGEIEETKKKLERQQEAVEKTLALLNLQPAERFSIVDEPDCLYIEASNRSDFSKGTENAESIAAFAEYDGITHCARVLALEDFENNVRIIEPSYVYAVRENESGCIANRSLRGVKRLKMGKCLRYYRRINREKSLMRESYEEMLIWIKEHGYEMRDDVLLVPRFLHLDENGDDVETIFAPIR